MKPNREDAAMERRIPFNMLTYLQKNSAKISATGINMPFLSDIFNAVHIRD